MKRSSWVRVSLLALVAMVVAVPAASAKKKEKVDVCKHGCDYRTIQDAVDATGKNAVINVRPGKYKEGVRIVGKKHNGVTIQGTGKNPKKVILEGKNAKDPEGQPANNGIEADGVNGVRVLNLWARNYLANGIFIHGDSVSGKSCNGYLMKNLRASFNRAYGLFAFNCIGGRMTKSVGYGHGDSAFYVGETPAQTKPKWTKLDHLDGYENVLGYSGTNSKYVKITQSNFYNNGAGVVPNTLDSERFEPTATGIIENNNIFWNNFNYFLPNSRVKTVSNGLGQIGDLTINFPTGVGIVLLGADGWIIRNNQIFGNFKAGAWAISDPFNEGDNAISQNNQFLDNAMGRGGTDTNAVDFFSDGSGSGNCFSGNVSSTFDPAAPPRPRTLYPSCPAPPPPASGTGTSAGDGDAVRRAGRLRGHEPAREPAVLVDRAPAPGVRELQAAERHAGADVPVRRRGDQPGRPPASPRSRSSRSRSRRRSAPSRRAGRPRPGDRRRRLLRPHRSEGEEEQLGQVGLGQLEHQHPQRHPHQQAPEGRQERRTSARAPAPSGSRSSASSRSRASTASSAPITAVR